MGTARPPTNGLTKAKRYSRNALIIVLLPIIGLVDGCGERRLGWFGLTFWYRVYPFFYGREEYFYPKSIALFIAIITACIAAPFLFVLLCNRTRKLAELIVSDSEAVGSYKAFIPVSKITLRMPIERIDNVSAVNSVFFC